MRTLAEKLGGNPESWEILGIIHDSDWEETKDNPHLHTIVTLDRLKSLGLTEGELVKAMKSHNHKLTNLAQLEGLMEWSLECCDELTGFIVACTLVSPSRKISDLSVESILKKFPQKAFAAAVDRSQISQCEAKLGIKLDEFVSLALKSMQKISLELGL
jgi:predicted hydrolase (HD superfamily)